ncbi:hypothetical protein Pla52o_34960 [Novipirellula galeiformis]|uniref:Helix-turn-helix domain protein n=1 Tax=Novipirellula galeiformis TaxID=2528004 RepID=A0A5C6CD11_9BACT|nr:helix-turn-helix domain-containing protein [Novipirellula galeiformis]TWU22440.1 hypothetical protein Pla52o_34960 [Novipirellula galeiformis]
MEQNQLAVDRRAAAKMLGIGPTKLWQITYPRGPVPSFRVGRAVRYSVADLRAFVDDRRRETAERIAKDIGLMTAADLLEGGRP